MIARPLNWEYTVTPLLNASGMYVFQPEQALKVPVMYEEATQMPMVPRPASLDSLSQHAPVA